MAFSEEYILWKEFHDGITNVETIISKEWEYFYSSHGNEWNPKLEEWEECVREWWCSNRYEKDRAAYKKIYERLIPYYNYFLENRYFDSFNFSVEFNYWREEDIQVEINYDLVGDDHDNPQYLSIVGTRDSIVEEIDKALCDELLFPKDL